MEGVERGYDFGGDFKHLKIFFNIVDITVYIILKIVRFMSGIQIWRERKLPL